MRHNPPMSLETVQNLNWVDWALGLILIGYVIAGIRRGFVMGVMDLLGMVVSLGAAILGYHQAATLLLQTVEIPSAIAYIGAFLGIVIVAQVVFTALVNLLFHVGRPVMIALGPISSLDKALGAFPGIVKGIIFSTLLLLPFALYPLVPQISAGVERSELGSRIVVAAIDTAPDLESLMGREITEGIGFLSPPQTDEGMKLNFGPVGKLVPDPAAEQKMFKMVNQERAKAGLRPLQWDEQLSQVARGHSMEMFQMGYFAHNSPVSGTPFDRMRQAGIAFLVAGENLAYAPNVQIAHEGLMNSPGHRANILRPEFGKIGIGVIESDFRGSMFSQEFTN